MDFLKNQSPQDDLIPVLGRSTSLQEKRYLALCDWAIGRGLMTIEDYRQWTRTFFHILKISPVSAFEKLQRMLKARAVQKETSLYWERKNKEANMRTIIDRALMGGRKRG